MPVRRAQLVDGEWRDLYTPVSHTWLPSYEEEPPPAPVYTTPDMPRDLVATAQVEAVTLTWDSPADTGGQPITHYVVVLEPGAITAITTELSYTFRGLTNETAYTPSVAAVNAVGQGPEATVDPVTPKPEPQAPPPPPPPDPTPKENVNTGNWWAARFKDVEAGAHSTLMQNARSGDGWLVYECGYYWQGYCSAYEASGDVWYADRMLDSVDAWIASSKVNRGGYRGWISRSHPQGSNGDEFALFDSYGWRFVARLMYLLKSDSRRAGAYERVRDFTQANIWNKWVSRGMSNLYRQNAHMASHWAVIGMHMAECGSTQAIRDKAREVAQNILHEGMPSPYAGRSIRKQLRANPANANAHWWNYNWGSYSRPGSDVNHGEAVVTACIYAYTMGYANWSTTDMTKFKVMLDKVIWPGRGRGSANVDGSGTGSGWLDGYARLGRWDADVQRALEKHSRMNQVWHCGNGMLNAVKMRHGMS